MVKSTLLLCFLSLATAQFCNLNPRSHPYKLSLCTMVHNEGWYIEEWIAYHLLVGVDHFYIYDDESTDAIQQVLSPYINQDIVSLIPWKHSSRTVDEALVDVEPSFTRPQRFAIADCLFNHKDETEWFGVWDMDEFALVNASFSDLHEFLDYQGKIADDYEIPVTVFGCEGRANTPNGLVLGNYLMRSNLTVFGLIPGDDTNKFSGKSLYRSGCGSPNVHFSSNLTQHEQCTCTKSTGGWLVVDGDRSRLPLTINHYAIKSWEHFKEKTKKWHFGLNKTMFDTHLQTTSSYRDEAMVKFVQPIEDMMECMSSHRT